ncbi:hypothetical protein [Arundinibacter roseus]|uniref:Uncharacterized protein n=1 Tax=Arundinibacter roseus TaxID=2070510 RepID=A0A4R4K1Z4_9BACT|nr:hypothetical protein [Arundinibacter roseus]TDB60381.1 hypothetical protein EZE20_20830 [Arundinibacter roseus]
MELKNGHIIIPVSLVEQVLQGEEQINLVYYPERSQLLFAGKSKTFFEKLHATKWMRLKSKNAQGDKALFVREILLDYDLDDSDRPLTYSVKNTSIIAVEL